VAGRGVEKEMRSETVFKVKVRMEDGSLRTFRQPRSIPVGTHVTVEGDTLSVVQKHPSGH
jgi:outer membrane lipoprotein SlyB